MPTTVTSIVDPTGGGDYTSLAAWQTAKVGDLVAADQIQVAECKGGGSLGPLTVAGWTTDATRYVVIKAVGRTNHHLGSWDDNKAKIDENGGIIQIAQDVDIVIQGLQIRNTSGSANQFCVRSTAPVGADNIVLRDCLLRGTESGDTFTYGVWASGPIRCYNCVTWGYQRGFFASSLTAGDIIYLSYCTFIGEGQGIWISDSDGTKTVNNCYCHGGSGNAWTLSGSATTDQVASSDATSPTAALRNKVHTTANFINVTSGSEDYHLATGSDLIGAANPDANVTEDYEEGTRDAVAPDVGADEFGVSGLAAPVASARTTRVPGNQLIRRARIYGGFF